MFPLIAELKYSLSEISVTSPSLKYAIPLGFTIAILLKLFSITTLSKVLAISSRLDKSLLETLFDTVFKILNIFCIPLFKFTLFSSIDF